MILKEQNLQTIDLIQARDTYKCPFVAGATLVKTNYYSNPVLKKVANTDSKTPGVFGIGDTLMIKNDFTFDVIRDGKFINKDIKWACSTLNKDSVKPSTSSSQQKDIQDLISFYKNDKGQPLYQIEEPTSDQLSKGEFTKVNLKNEKGFEDKFKFDYFIWKRTGLRQTKGPQQINIIKTFTDKGWLDLGGSINPADSGLYIDPPLNLKSKYSKDFENDYYLFFPLSKVNTKPIVDEIENLVVGDLGDRSNCKKIIKNYNILAQKQAPVNDATIESWKTSVKQCQNNVKNYLDLNQTNNILKKLESNNTKWGLSPNVKKENYSNLKTLVRENLLKEKDKKNNLITERKIAKDRFNILLENRKFNTKLQKQKVYLDILKESNLLYESGFDSKVITESFFNTITGIFGNSGTGIIQNIKEYFAEYIVKKFGVDPEGWMGSLITTSIGNLDLTDIPKLLNCNFTTKLLSKSLAETAIKKIQSSAGLEGTLSNILRNSLVESLEENSTLMVKLEEAVGSFICPLISKISGNLDKESENIRTKALAA